MKNLFGEEVRVDYDCLDSDFWATPVSLYPKDCFDPCPINPSFDGLKISWKGKVFVNPPYSQIDKWIFKGLIEINTPEVESIIFLLPAWTDRQWFLMIKDCEIEFLQGRVAFEHPVSRKAIYSPRFGSMLVKLL
jgi:hypothetical protein